MKPVYHAAPLNGKQKLIFVTQAPPQVGALLTLSCTIDTAGSLTHGET